MPYTTRQASLTHTSSSSLQAPSVVCYCGGLPTHGGPGWRLLSRLVGAAVHLYGWMACHVLLLNTPNPHIITTTTTGTHHRVLLWFTYARRPRMAFTLKACKSGSTLVWMDGTGKPMMMTSDNDSGGCSDDDGSHVDRVCRS